MKELIDSYYKWLKENTLLNTVGEYTEVTTPFLDRHNDYIEIYMKKLDTGDILITDDSYTLSDLEDSGFLFNTPKRKELLNNILLSHSLSLDENNAIITQTSVDDFPYRKHFYIQGILSINDLFVTNKSNVSTLFIEDVTTLLDDKDIRYVSDVKITGKSGYSHNIDFTIPHSKLKPDRYLQLVNTPNKSTTEINLFAWNDIKEVRNQNSSMYVLLNDIDNKVRKDILSAYNKYDIKTLLWSNKDELIDELSA
ncbi:MAG: hypothetical protein K0R54_4985 [Clostridiaceae bacterium]|jgi:hypothetical protein|nr:hypothetical protein [Clostridiaceae bacterium]